MEFNVFLDFLVAIALGALIGVERQRGQKTGGFAGIRTFIMISFLGALTAFLYQELENPQVLLLTFFSIVALITASYIISAIKGYEGITAEVSAYICFFLGFFVMFEKYKNYGLVFGVIITIVLSFKRVLHRFVEGAKTVEWNDTLKFALIAFVILPLLPSQVTIPIFDQGPYYDLNIFYPKEIWLLVVFVSAVSFVGYFILKIIGPQKGANLIGALGGLVSSTAVTQSMATHSKAKVGKSLVNYKPLAIAVLLATIVSFTRAGIICISVNNSLMPILMPIGTIIIVGAIWFLISSRSKGEIKAKLKLESPFKLKPALTLGILYTIITFISKLSFATNIGKSGIVLASIITGLFDMDPIILAVSKLSSAGTITVNDAIGTILLGIASNQLTKSFVSISSGSKKFGQCVSRILLTFVVIIIIWVFYFKLV